MNFGRPDAEWKSTECFSFTLNCKGKSFLAIHKISLGSIPAFDENGKIRKPFGQPIDPNSWNESNRLIWCYFSTFYFWSG